MNGPDAKPTVAGPRPRRPTWVLWTLVAALILAPAAVLGHLFWSDARDRGRKEAIRGALADRRWSDAEHALRRWLRDHPRDGEAWEALGGLLAQHDRPDEALAALRRVPESSPSWAGAQARIGEILAQQRDLKEAERAFRRALGRDPGAVETLKRLSSLLVLERRPAEARDVLRALFRATRDPRPLADSILITRLESEIRDMTEDIEAYLRQTPDDPWLRRVWGLYLLSRSRAAEAFPHLEAAALAFDDDPLGRFALAECRMALGDSRNDLAILGDPPDRPADAARWWVFRARLAEAWGLDNEALASLRTAVAHDHRNTEALHRLGRALVRRGELEAGRIALTRAEAHGIQEEALIRELRRRVREGFDANGFAQLGRLCQEAGMAVEARDWFDLASEHNPRIRPMTPDQLASPDDGPSVALSRPVPKPSGTLSAEPTPELALQASVAPRFEDLAVPANVYYRYDAGATPNLFIADTMGGGVGLIDYDDDGWLDLYFVNGCPLPIDGDSTPRPNRLYHNRGDGTFEDHTERAGVAGAGYGMGCAVGDYDNDGRDDLFVTGLDRTILYRNRGDGTFEDVTERAGVQSARWTTAAGFGDLDGDGDLDLVVIAYVEADPARSPECRDRTGRLIHCQPERFPAQLDYLFRNNGDGTFTDVSREAGVEGPGGRGLGLAIADFDGDGRLDLFVANDGTPNFLYRNLGGLRFEEVGDLAAVSYDATGQPTASMGVVADDLNGDGLIDLLHTNFVNQASTLRWNVGGGLFRDGTLAAGLGVASRAKTGWGAVALDVENDGRLDLFAANGHTDDQPWLNSPMAQTAQLFLGRDSGRFVLAGAEATPYLARPLVGRGVAAGDLDNDGRVDLVVVHRDAPAALLYNRTTGGHWLGLLLRGTRSGRTPVGAQVTCQAGDRRLVRWLTSGTSYLSANDPRLWFGLGPVDRVERLEVRWPSGTVQSWTDLPADQILDLREGGEPVRRLAGPR
jgi:tetratricopeptide (TPR) repeat protein